jgi:hypothetical protein
VLPGAWKSEGREPKAEGNPKPEIRNTFHMTGSVGDSFGLRISDLFRVSAFGPSDLGWTRPALEQCEALDALSRTLLTVAR